MENKASAKDFFLHLGGMVALYAIVISFVNLLFRVINKSFPEIVTNGYYWSSGSEISMPVATLIVVFPIFILLNGLLNKTYALDQTKKNLGVRKWLIYITLFIAGIILAGDLITVLYKFLDGQDLTAAFLLKALVVLLTSGAVFGFYLADIREHVSNKSRKIWAIVTSVLLLFAIILGFSVLGSPQSQRLLRYDNQRIMDLQNMQWQIINYWQEFGSLPASITEMQAVYGVNPEAGPSVASDPQSFKPYEYKKTGPLSFELCAEFNKSNLMTGNERRAVLGGPYLKGGMLANDNWDHPAGKHCFPRTIDPVTYPTRVRG